MVALLAERARQLGFECRPSLWAGVEPLPPPDARGDHGREGASKLTCSECLVWSDATPWVKRVAPESVLDEVACAYILECAALDDVPASLTEHQWLDISFRHTNAAASRKCLV